MQSEAALATGIADENVAQQVIGNLLAKQSATHQPTSVKLTIELGCLTPEVLKALQAFIALSCSAGMAAGTSAAGDLAREGPDGRGLAEKPKP